MATLAVQSVGKNGLADIVFSAASAGGDSVPAGIVNANFGLDQVVLLIKNAHTASWTVTVAGLPGLVVPNTKEGAIPVNKGVYPGALVAVTYSGVTALTVAAVKL